MDKVQQYFSQYPKQTYPKGQIVIFAGEEPEFVYYLAKGRVRQYDVSYRGDEVVLNVFKNGAFFPMSWAINRTPNRFFFKAEVQTELHTVPVEQALQFLHDNPDVAFDLLSRIYRGMDGLLGRMVHLMSGTARSRLIYEIIIEYRRLDAKDNATVQALEVTETDLAARCGLSRETVSREMQRMKKAGWVVVDNKQIAVHDIARLEATLGASV